MKRFLVTLNWNSTEMLIDMIKSVEATTPEPHRWIVIDNGSRIEQENALFEFFGMYRGDWGKPEQASKQVLAEFLSRRRAEMPSLLSSPVMSYPYDPDGEFDKRYLREQIVRDKDRSRGGSYIISASRNLGCVLAHNLAFDICQWVADDDPFEIVMLDADVIVTEQGWLSRVLEWADSRPNVGIIGMERPEGQTCSMAVFLDPSGNWYGHIEQVNQCEPAPGESAGLGFALIRWPVLAAGLRFDVGYILYYKQDDDLCLDTRAKLGLQVWAFPVGNIHLGSGALKANNYDVADGARGWGMFDAVKQRNQRYFAEKWRWALRNRRANMAEEVHHLAEIEKVMAARR